MKILVTGANGFIGSHIARAFCRAGESDITALVRPSADIRFIRRYNVGIIHADLCIKESLNPGCLQQYNTIVHAAAKVGDWGDYREFYTTNVLGSIRLFDSTSSDSTFIYISSNAVLGEEDNLSEKCEYSPYKPELKYFLESFMPSAMNHYRVSKAIAEMFLVKRAQKTGRRLIVVRPVWVFGPREMHAGPYEYCKAVASGLKLMPGSVKNSFHTIYVSDLARIVAAIASNPRNGVSIYNVGNPDVPRMSDYWGMFCDAMRVERPGYLPKWLLYLPATILEAGCKFLGCTDPPLFTRARVYMFYANNIYNVSKVIDEYGIKCFTSHKKAVNTTVRWWRRYGYLNDMAEKSGSRA